MISHADDIAVPTPTERGATLTAWLGNMRERHPVWRDGSGVHHVFRYVEVDEVLSHPGTYSSDRGRITPGMERLAPGNLTMADPPEHTALRAVVSRAFGPRTVARLQERMATLASELLDGIDGPEFDLMAAFAYPFTVTVITELLGVPATDRAIFARWAERGLAIQVAGPTNSGLATAFERAREEMTRYLAEHCAARRRDPADDMISMLATAEVDGRRLDDEELVNFTALLLGAGYSTTMLMVGNIVLCLDDSPAAAAAVRTDRTRVDGFVEEVLRLRPSISLATRATTRPVELCGVPLPENAVVMAWLLSANRDERVFPDAARFDAGRDGRRGMAFGRGIHFCIGAALARLEGRAALAALLDRFPEIRIRPGGEVPMYEHGGFGVPSSIFGARELPVTVAARGAR